MERRIKILEEGYEQLWIDSLNKDSVDLTSRLKRIAAVMTRSMAARALADMLSPLYDHGHLVYVEHSK